MFELALIELQLKLMLQVMAQASLVLHDYQLGMQRNALARAEQRNAEFRAMIARGEFNA